MKYFLPNIKKYKLIKNIVYLLIFFIICVFIKWVDFNVYILLFFVFLFFLSLFNNIFYQVMFKKYQKNTYMLLNDVEIINNINKIYTIYFQKDIIPIQNILWYEIRQGYIMRYFSLYKLSISSSSDTTSIYVDEDNIYKLEDTVKLYIDKNIIKENNSEKSKNKIK